MDTNTSSASPDACTSDTPGHEPASCGLSAQGKAVPVGAIPACGAPPSKAAPRDYGGVGLWMLRILVMAGTVFVTVQGVQRMMALTGDPVRWAKVIGPHWYATVTSFSLVAFAMLLAVCSGPIVRGIARVWNVVTRRVRPPTRLDEVVLLLGAVLILFQASLLFEILGGF